MDDSVRVAVGGSGRGSGRRFGCVGGSVRCSVGESRLGGRFMVVPLGGSDGGRAGAIVDFIGHCGSVGGFVGGCPREKGPLRQGAGPRTPRGLPMGCDQKFPWESVFARLHGTSLRKWIADWVGGNCTPPRRSGTVVGGSIRRRSTSFTGCDSRGLQSLRRPLRKSLHTPDSSCLFVC